MLVCPNGHVTTEDQQLCEQCDAMLVVSSSPPTQWYHRPWFFVGCGAVAALLISAVVAGLVVGLRSHEKPAAPTTDRAAIAQWWASGAQKHVAALQDALDDASQSLQRFDKFGVERACQRMHDAAVVDLRAHLPSPDPDLTAEIDAAIEDAHTTAHVCMSAISGSANNYDTEFRTYLDQATKHLKAATDIVDESQPRA